MIERRNEKENEKINKKGSEEGNGRNNQCWVVLVFTLCYENLIDFLIYISGWWEPTKFSQFLFFPNSPGFQIGQFLHIW